MTDGACVFSPSNEQAPTDLGCKTWDWNNQICLECSQWWVMVDGNCVPVSDHCAAHDDNGDCTECFDGYDLTDGACVFSPSNEQGPTDLGCKTWDWKNQICLECSQWWVMVDGSCVPVSDHCAAHDDNGDCTECYVGFELQDGSCIETLNFCKTFNEDKTC